MALNIDCTNSFQEKKQIRRGKRVFTADKLMFALKFLLPVLIVFVSYATIAFVANNTNRLSKKCAALSSEIKGFNREIENTNLKIQAAKGRNIAKQMNRFSLNLIYPKPGQKKELSNTVAANAKLKGREKAVTMKKKTARTF